MLCSKHVYFLVVGIFQCTCGCSPRLCECLR